MSIKSKQKKLALVCKNITALWQYRTFKYLFVKVRSFLL